MTKQIVIIAIALLLGLTAAAVRLVAGGHKEGKKARYRSSIQVPDKEDEKEAREEKGEKEENEADEAAEEAQLQSLAKITKQQAIDAALKQVPGKLVKAELDNEDGNLVYSVEVKTPAGISDVKVDAGNAKVLFVDRDDEEDDDN